MTMNAIKKCWAAGISLVLIVASSYGFQDTPPGASGGAYDGAPMSASELQSLVAPIALYPDKLVAQILSAATFPDQVAVADYWLKQQHVTGSPLMQEVGKQPWDSSVKALTAFPSVLDNMAKNLTWTSSLGEAYHNQPSEVMSAIQTLRAKAKAAGNLQSNSKITVVQQTPQTIVIEPTNPQVVYVPMYDPASIYGTPYVTPGYTAGDVAAAGVLGFGSGVAVGALAGSGWNSWGCNWNGGAVVYNHNNFYGNSAWHGGYYNHNSYNYNKAEFNNFHGSANRYDNVDRDASNFNRHGEDSWARADDSFGRSNAFSGFGDHAGGFGGWASRAHSFRGWGSMGGGGFGGGRFGGGGFGGGHFGGFHGGGFRR